jgi:hypothetical protein
MPFFDALFLADQMPVKNQEYYFARFGCVAEEKPITHFKNFSRKQYVYRNLITYL